MPSNGSGTAAEFFKRLRQDTAEDTWTKGPNEPIDGERLSKEIRNILTEQVQHRKAHKPGEWIWSLRLEEVQVQGDLCLRGLEFPFVLALRKCTVDGKIDLSESTIEGSLELQETTADALVAKDLTVRHNVDLEKSQFLGEGINLQRAAILGRVLATGARVENQAGYSFCLDAGTVKSGVSLNYGFHCIGGATLQRAKIWGNLDARGGTFEVPDAKAGHQDALRCHCVEVRGDILIHCTHDDQGVGMQFQSIGTVSLIRAHIHGSVLGYGGEFRSRGQKVGRFKPALDAEEATVEGSFILKNYEREGEEVLLPVRCEGMVKLRRARIRGRVSCSGAQLDGLGRSALVADEAQVGANLDLKFGFSAHGGVFLEGIHIAGNLDCRGARFTLDEQDADERNALDFHDAEIGGDVLLKDYWDDEGLIRLPCQQGPWLHFESSGCVNFFRAEIKGSLECHGATFRACGAKSRKAKPSLNAEEARIEGSALLRCFEFPEAQNRKPGSPVQCFGTISFYRATIGRRLVLGGARLYADAREREEIARSGVALRAQEIEVAQSVELNCSVHGGEYFRFQATGEVNLDRARLGGSLDCGGGRFWADRAVVEEERHPRDDEPLRPALSLRDAQVEGNLWLTRPMMVVGERESAPAFEAEGRISLPRTRIQGAVSFEGATLRRVAPMHNFEKHDKRPLAIRMDDAQIGGILSFRDMKFHGPVPLLISANAIDVQSTCWMTFEPSAKEKYELELQGATFKKFLIHPKNSWPAQGFLHINGLQYSLIQLWKDDESAQMEDMGKKQAKRERKKRHRRFKEWLALQPNNNIKLASSGEISAADRRQLLGQPYEQMIKALRQEGDREGAREIAIAKQRLEAEDLPWWILWAHRFFLGRLIDYGYRPWRVLVVMAFFWLVGSGVFWLADRYGFMKPTDGTVVVEQHRSRVSSGASNVVLGQQEVPDSYPRFNPLAFSADTFLPIINLHQATYWLPQETPGFSWAILFAYYLWFHTAAGWILATIAIAGLSGIVKTE